MHLKEDHQHVVTLPMIEMLFLEYRIWVVVIHHIALVNQDRGDHYRSWLRSGMERIRLSAFCNIQTVHDGIIDH